MKTISIAKDFTRYPAGRYKSDGDYSGEHFREKFLEPVLNSRERAIINFDGARGYGSSFLEEAFGGLVRMGYSAEEVLQAFVFQSSDPSIIIEVKNYINEATE